MLEQVASMFDNMELMLKKLKKKTYEPRMNEFRENYGHFINEMTDYIEQQEDKTAATEKMAETFVTAVKERFTVKGKIGGRKQADMNFFMIYYVFPAILLTEHEEADALASAICSCWSKTFKDSKIGYTSYEILYNSFRNKIFGIF